MADCGFIRPLEGLLLGSYSLSELQIIIIVLFFFSKDADFSSTYILHVIVDFFVHAESSFMYGSYLNNFLFLAGEELSKKQAAQETQIRKLRAQVCKHIYEYFVFLYFNPITANCSNSQRLFLILFS